MSVIIASRFFPYFFSNRQRMVYNFGFPSLPQQPAIFFPPYLQLKNYYLTLYRYYWLLIELKRLALRLHFEFLCFIFFFFSIFSFHKMVNGPTRYQLPFILKSQLIFFSFFPIFFFFKNIYLHVAIKIRFANGWNRNQFIKVLQRSWNYTHKHLLLQPQTSAWQCSQL